PPQRNRPGKYNHAASPHQVRQSQRRNGDGTLKIRIKSHSIRFRLDPDDLQQFLNDGYLTVNTHIPTPGGEPMVFSSRVTRGRDDEESRLTAEPFGFTLKLSPADCDRLASTDEGIYIRRE